MLEYQKKKRFLRILEMRLLKSFNFEPLDLCVLLIANAYLSNCHCDLTLRP